MFIRSSEEDRHVSRHFLAKQCKYLARNMYSDLKGLRGWLLKVYMCWRENSRGGSIWICFNNSWDRRKWTDGFGRGSYLDVVEAWLRGVRMLENNIDEKGCFFKPQKREVSGMKHEPYYCVWFWSWGWFLLPLSTMHSSFSHL